MKHLLYIHKEGMGGMIYFNNSGIPGLKIQTLVGNNVMKTKFFPSLITATFLMCMGAQASTFVINQGTFDTGTGAFTRNTTEPVDARQGLVQSFASVSLDNPGDWVQATFTWQGGGGNNSANQLFFGFFDGPTVTADAQTSSTDDWIGGFQTIATRNSNGGVNSAALFQGDGAQPLFNHPDAVSSGADVDGGRAGTSGHRPPFNQSIENPVTMRFERIDDDFISLITTYTTPREDGSSSGSGDGISWVQTASGGIATFTSTYSVNDVPTSISGIALAGSANFTMTDLQVTAIPEPGTIVLLGLAGLAGLISYRRRT
ncbi:MAG: PEP-CTERM sorting domain-containing protein [Opitutales bacterium]